MIELAETPEGVAHAVRTTARNDWAAMAVAAELASGFDEAAIRVGHRLEREARRRNLMEHTTIREPHPRTVLGKLRAMLSG